MQKNESNLDLYTDEEVQQGMQELFTNEKFVTGMQNFLPQELSQYILATKDQVKSIYDFQAKITRPFLNAIKDISISELSVSGLENINAEDKFLFISNHRNIVLDSAYLNLLLFENKISTSQIAIGDNLMKTRVSELLFRINKSFVVKRDGGPRELYAHSVALSKYIHELITEKKDSVWIAQREGRAKDGNDQTQQGLLKMIGLNGGKKLKEYFQSLKIIPVAISYEFDPTDLQKTQEYLKKQIDPNFKKSFQEDVKYMLHGIQGEKGKVHFNFGKPLQQELEVFDTCKNSKEQIACLAELIDKSIHCNYQLHPVNYVAYDLFFKMKKYASHYSEQEFKKYTAFFEKHVQQIDESQREAGKEYLLKMYVNPVVNALKYKN